jgi:hypothetical protein
VAKRLRVFQVATGNVGTDIDNVTCIESVDVSCHHSAETWANCGFGRPVDDPEPTHTDFSSVDAFAAIGMTVTGMPALNSIRAVVDAPPGIVTSADQPLRAFAGRFAR